MNSLPQLDPQHTAAQQRTLIQNEAFQATINGEPLLNALNILARMVKLELGSHVRTAFYLAYPDGKRLHAIEGAGDMDPAYTAPLNGFPVSDDSFCSGYAMATGRPVHTPDVFQNPQWQPYRPLATTHGFRAASSYPILTRQGKAIGSLALYFPHVHQATAHEETLAKAITQAAVILLSQDTQTFEHTRAEEALHQSEQRLQLALEATELAVYEWDLISDRLTANERFRELLSIGSDEMILGARVMEHVVHPDDRAHVDPDLSRVMDSGSTGKFVFEHRLSDSSPLGERWVLSHGQVFFSGPEGNRQPSRVFGTLQDITERKHREQTQELLLTLSDKIRPLTDPVPIEGEVTQLLRAHVDAGWCYYVGWDETSKLGVVRRDATRQGLASLVGDHDVSDVPEFLELLKANPLLAVSDYEHYEQLTPALRHRYTSLGFRSMLVATLVKQERLVASLLIGDTKVRHWSTQEEALLMEVAERTWVAVEKAKAEEALRRSEEQFRTLIDSMPLIVSPTTPDGKAEYVNQEWTAFSGRPREEFISGEWVNTIHPDDGERVMNTWGAALASGQRYQYELRALAKSGRYRWLLAQGLPIRNSEGTIIRWLNTALDIDDRKVAEEALRESQKRFESIANLVPDLLWESQPDGTTNWYNQRWLEYTGQRFEEAIGWGWVEAIHPDDREASAKRYGQAVAMGTSLRQEHRIRRHDGVYRWFVVSASPRKDESGQVVEMYGAAMDIDDHKRLEAALLEADRRKDEFLAMLAHELRNPMSTIRSGLTILNLTTTEEMGLGATVASTVDMMNRQTDHLVRMVDDLLDVSRISRGKIELKPERVDLVELVSQACESVRTLYQEQGKRLQLNLPEAPIYLDGDATRLTQVVANLLTNGVRYTGEQGQVWVSLSHRDKEAILSVRDNGIGLPADQLKTIFDLFVQVDNSTARSKGGLGLGLTLVKRLVEMHGGRVEAQSEGLGKGSTFTVHLPMSAAAAEPTPTATPQAADPATANRILVIDDNVDAAQLMAILLKLKGYETHTRTSGRAGIDATKDLQPEAILLDIGMPELDGYATCRLIREQAWGQSMVIIALTGYGQEEDRQRTQEAGFNGHLVKPVDLGALIKMLTNLLDRDRN